MKCKLCGKPTEGFFQAYHQACMDSLQKELAVLDKLIIDYENGTLSGDQARRGIIQASSVQPLENFLWNKVYNRTTITYSNRLIFCDSGIEVLEEKNRCTMVRTGLSYARYPRWACNTIKLCDYATLALTDSGVYCLDKNDLYIPYSKIVDVGVDCSFRCKYLYFDVKTTSPHRHRYSLRLVANREDNYINNICSLLRIMANIPQKTNSENRMENTP